MTKKQIMETPEEFDAITGNELELERQHAEQMKQLQRNAVKKLGTLISDNIIDIAQWVVLIIIPLLIMVAVYGFWLWLNVTKDTTECVKTISQARWDDYKHVVDLAKSSTIVALVAIMLKHKNKQ